MNGDKRILQLAQNITQSINNSGLSAGTVYYVLKDILNQVNMIYMQEAYAKEPDKQDEPASDQGAE